MSNHDDNSSDAPAVVCPRCDADATRGEHRDHCAACGWRDDLCPTCGQPMCWDPDRRGTTVGGLDVVGALVCCGNVELSRASRPADAVGWQLAKGGRSLNAGGIRVRADGGAGEDVQALMSRLVRLPDLELEVARLREALARREHAV